MISQKSWKKNPLTVQVCVTAVLCVEEDSLVGLALRLARDGDAVDLAGRDEDGVIGRGHAGDGGLGLLDLRKDRNE